MLSARQEQELLRHLLEMLAGGECSPDVEAVAEGQHEGDDDLQVQRQLEEPYAGGDGEEDEEEPDVSADGRSVDKQHPALVPASPEDKSRDPDDEHGEGCEHERRAEYRPYTYEGALLGCFAREDGLEDGDDGDHALGQGGAHRGEQASHGSLAHTEPPPEYLDRVRKEGGPKKDRDQRRHELERRYQIHSPSPLGRAARRERASHRGQFACQWSRSVRLGAGNRPGASLRTDGRSPATAGGYSPITCNPT